MVDKLGTVGGREQEWANAPGLLDLPAKTQGFKTRHLHTIIYPPWDKIYQWKLSNAKSLNSTTWRLMKLSKNCFEWTIHWQIVFSVLVLLGFFPCVTMHYELSVYVVGDSIRDLKDL